MVTMSRSQSSRSRSSRNSLSVSPPRRLSLSQEYPGSLPTSTSISPPRRLSLSQEYPGSLPVSPSPAGVDIPPARPSAAKVTFQTRPSSSPGGEEKKGPEDDQKRQGPVLQRLAKPRGKIGRWVVSKSKNTREKGQVEHYIRVLNRKDKQSLLQWVTGAPSWVADAGVARYLLTEYDQWAANSGKKKNKKLRPRASPTEVAEYIADLTRYPETVIADCCASKPARIIVDTDPQRATVLGASVLVDDRWYHERCFPTAAIANFPVGHVTQCNNKKKE